MQRRFDRTLQNLEAALPNLGLTVNPLKSRSLWIQHGSHSFLLESLRYADQAIEQVLPLTGHPHMGLTLRYDNCQWSSPVEIIHGVLRDIQTINHPLLDAFQRIDILRSVILARIPFYSREFPCYPVEYLAFLDRKIRSSVKETLQLTLHFPTAMLHCPTKAGGFGLPSFFYNIFADGIIFPLRLLDSPRPWIRRIAEASLRAYAIDPSSSRVKREMHLWNRLEQGLRYLAPKTGLQIEWRTHQHGAIPLGWNFTLSDGKQQFLPHRLVGMYVHRQINRSWSDRMGAMSRQQMRDCLSSLLPRPSSSIAIFNSLHSKCRSRVNYAFRPRLLATINHPATSAVVVQQNWRRCAIFTTNIKFLRTQHRHSITKFSSSFMTPSNDILPWWQRLGSNYSESESSTSSSKDSTDTRRTSSIPLMNHRIHTFFLTSTW